MKSHPIANLEIQHLRVRAHLAQKPQPLDDPMVQINQFLFAEFVDVKFHDSSRVPAIVCRPL
jgi:hypothetical protein